MFDHDLIESLDPATKIGAKNALAFLAASGLIESQRLRLFAHIANRVDTGDLYDVAEEVKTYRLTVRNYLSLQALGDTLNKEREDAIANEE